MSALVRCDNFGCDSTVGDLAYALNWYVISRPGAFALDQPDVDLHFCGRTCLREWAAK